MSNKGQFQPPPKYMSEFSKALAGEVKILLTEVGQLRDEKRQLQHEIADLMATRSKYGSGGEYAPNWAPKREPTPPPPSPPPAPLAIEDVEPARPAWRTIQKRPEGRRTKQKTLPAPPPPLPVPEPPAPANLPAWAQWRPNPLLSPQPQLASPSAQSPAMIPPRVGLFGTPSPPPP